MDFKELFGEELATQIEEVIKEKNINLIADDKTSPAWIPKARMDEVITQKNELKTQLGESTKQLETLKSSAKGDEKLTKQIEELQQSNQQWQEKHKETVLKQAVKFKALESKSKDISILEKLIDYNGLELQDDGSIKGLDEQITALKENHTYLFDAGEQTPPTGNRTPNNPPNSQGAGQLSKKEKYLALQQKVYENPNNTQLKVALFQAKQELTD